ncbi:hypothetical protein KVR01_006785 [Diaporthe batatas]|uniref:uncharacterized protein n=1 Tax=Diaporthe batatas TaxID=748121 RepID=UPI001D03FDC9|nr:uncharacterized protein KVR01_006785 [Diaporthe batatas]KAG8163488.1 hypothetical protein KVR01_006785 [Diaporthe batatas]
MPDSWSRPLSAEDIRKLYQDWPSHVSRAVNEPEQPAIYLWGYLSTRTYVSCLPALSAMLYTPQLLGKDSGAGMCIEDGLITSTLSRRAQNREKALVALKAYLTVATHAPSSSSFRAGTPVCPRQYVARRLD